MTTPQKNLSLDELVKELSADIVILHSRRNKKVSYTFDMNGYLIRIEGEKDDRSEDIYIYVMADLFEIHRIYECVCKGEK